MLKRLRIKFVCVNMAIVTIMLCVIFGTVLHFTKVSLEQDSIQMMHSAAEKSNHPGIPGAPAQQPHFILHLDKNGTLVASSSNYYDLTDVAFLDELIAAAAASGEPAGVISQYDLRFCRINTPWGQKLVFADMSAENSILSSLLRNCCIIALASFLLFLVISILLSKWAIRPVEEAWQQQKQFVADASHELKTPLTVIMTNAELLQKPDQNDASKAQFSSSILIMANQMRGLVESLLALARADNSTEHDAFAEVDLSQLIAEAILPFEPLYFEKGLTLEEEIDSGIRLKGIEAHLRQLPDILLDNAMKYADPNTAVHIHLKKHGLHALLSVSNAGPTIPPDEISLIFRRFYRSDKARSRTGSYGLGLSIAQSITDAHRGKIWAESHGGINTFFIQLPL